MAEHWLVISNAATNSGAPRILLEILRGTRAARQDWTCEILLRYGGVLLPEFARLGPVHVLAHPWAEGRSLRARLYRRFVDRPWRQPRRLARWLKFRESPRFDFVYNNTATNGDMVHAAHQLRRPILTHVHELGSGLRRFNTPAELAQTLMLTDYFIAVSQPAKSDLVECGVPGDRISVVPNFIPALPAEPNPANRAILRRELGLPSDAFIVTGCGHIDRIKGTDHFVVMAAALAERMQGKLAFTWLGGVTDPRYARKVRGDVRRRGLENLIRFVGPVGDATAWFAASDVVAVTSREESFSLVAMEAAALGRPVAGFSGARGLNAVLGDVPEMLAPEHNAVALAEIVYDILQDPARAAGVGRRLRVRIGTEFVARIRIPEILSIVGGMRRRGSN